MIGKMIIQEKSLSNVWEAEDFLSGMLSFKARWFSGHDLFGFFAPKSWGFNNYDSQFDVYVSTHQQDSSRKSFQVFKHTVGLKEFTPKLMFDAVKNGLLVRVTFDVPIDN